MNKETIEETLFIIKTDLSSVKTDVAWLKRIFSIIVVMIVSLFSLGVGGAI